MKHSQKRAPRGAKDHYVHSQQHTTNQKLLDESLLLSRRVEAFSSGDLPLSQLADYLSSSKKLKEQVRTQFIPQGEQLIQALLTAAEEDQSTSSMKALCVLFTSYHLKSYNITGKTVQKLNLMSLGFLNNEQKARLALNCIADLLMKLPQWATLAFPSVSRILVQLTDHMDSGLKLFYSLLRSLYYCLLCKDLKIDRKEILTVFLSIRRLICGNQCTVQEKYIDKARGFAHQALQTLYKENSKLLFPYIGIYLKDDMGHHLHMLKTLATFAESTPFNFYQLNKEDSKTKNLYPLARRLLDTFYGKFLEVLGEDEEMQMAGLRLAQVALKCPLQVSDMSRVKDTIDLIKKISADGLASTRKQAFSCLSAACIQYSDYLLECLSFEDLRAMLRPEEILSTKLTFLKDLGKKSTFPETMQDVLTDKLEKYTTHTDYKVKNAVFELYGAINAMKESGKLTRIVLKTLSDYIAAMDHEGIIPCLNMLSSFSLSSVPEALKADLFAILNQNKAPLLTGTVLKFIGLLLGQGYLSERFHKDFIKKMLFYAKSNTNNLLNDIGTALLYCAESPEISKYLSEILEISQYLSKAQKTSSHTNLMNIFASVLQMPGMNGKHMAKILEISLVFLESSNSTTCVAASTVIKDMLAVSEEFKRSTLLFLTDRILEVLSASSNFKTKTALLQLISQLVCEDNAGLVIDKVFKELEHEKSRVICDPFLINNHSVYKEELFLLLANSLLLPQLTLRDVKKFLMENMHPLVKCIRHLSHEIETDTLERLSKALLEWVDTDSDIPISFDCYDKLNSIHTGGLDNVTMSTSDELDLEFAF